MVVVLPARAVPAVVPNPGKVFLALFAAISSNFAAVRSPASSVVAAGRTTSVPLLEVTVMSDAVTVLPRFVGVLPSPAVPFEASVILPFESTVMFAFVYCPSTSAISSRDITRS